MAPTALACRDAARPDCYQRGTCLGAACPVSVKLDSSDFVKGGFTRDECLQVVIRLSATGIDLPQVSGGTCKQIEFFKTHDPAGIRDSAREREATFLKHAKRIKAAANMPVMIAGGFRTLGGMEAAPCEGQIDLIGVARPLCLDPDFPARMLAGTLATPPVPEHRLIPGKGWHGPHCKSPIMRVFNNQAHAGLVLPSLLGAGLAPRPELSPWRALPGHLRKDCGRAMARKRALSQLRGD